MATNIPPHNMAEIVDATVALIKNPNLSDEQLFRLVPAPDFPTGGERMECLLVLRSLTLIIYCLLFIFIFKIQRVYVNPVN